MAVANSITVTVDVGITEKTVEKCLRVLDIWLADNQDKTIRVEDEDGVRVCLIEEVEHG